MKYIKHYQGRQLFSRWQQGPAVHQRHLLLIAASCTRCVRPFDYNRHIIPWIPQLFSSKFKQHTTSRSKITTGKLKCHSILLSLWGLQILSVVWILCQLLQGGGIRLMVVTTSLISQFMIHVQVTIYYYHNWTVTVPQSHTGSSHYCDNRSVQFTLIFVSN